MSSPVNSIEQISRVLLLIPLLPLFGSFLVYFVTARRQNRPRLAGWLATLAAASSFAAVLCAFAQLNQSGAPALTAFGWKWFGVEALSIEFAFRFDRLAAVMSLIITGVGSLIHLYAIGYMADDEHRPRFFAYLNLFLFAMLLLVLGDNLLVMFVGWEGVGLCSYLLIGFWYKEMGNAKAGQKAFVVNRIGDAGFLLGIFTLIGMTGTVNFVELQAAISSLPAGVIEAVAILLFVGAVGKSAQIPLFIWLPDAMAGPTPVSALIHAATMVTAGVYMIARMSFLYVLAPNTLMVITVIGALTALLAASIALVQNDIKKVLAYSTVSQLGYMFMAMGAAAFSNGIFHVVTHAFFKACLFMAAGSVIVGCHHEQDMRKFGGLWKKMPWTFITYLVATFAIAGFPGLSGFYSKDAILWTTFYQPKDLPLLSNTATILGGVPLNQFCWGIGIITAFLTAFYMTRSLVMTFFGSYRGHHEAHESPWVVTVPLVILAALSAGFGLLYGEQLMHYLEAWTRADMAVGHAALAENPAYHSLEMMSIVVAVSGMLLAALCYTVLPGIPKRLSKLMPKFYEFLVDKWRIDELYDAMVIRPLLGTSKFLFRVIDRFLIDDIFVNGTGMFVEASGDITRRMQNGKIGSYALGMFFTAFVLILFYMIFIVIP
jgi:NADH-quinone oxidoreductase subunit L